MEAAFSEEIVLSRLEGGEGVAQEAPESFPPAVFKHDFHRIRYACSACHPTLFEMKRGSTLVTMSDMADGAACGACHRDQGEAFGMVRCGVCHVEPERDTEAEG